jgi:hypothetical protein
MYKRKSWREKLADDKGLPKVVPIGAKMRKQFGEGTVVIPAPREVDAIMRKVPAGKLITISEIRQLVAKRHKADVGCHITCGIFAWIAAHAAEESRAAGARDVTPYWRTLKTGGELNPKYPGGVEAIRRYLKKEGHKVESRGKRFFVADFQKDLVKLRA